MRGEKLPITIVRRSRKYTNLEIIVLYFNSAYINIYSLKVSSKSELFSHSYEFLSDMPGKRAWESSQHTEKRKWNHLFCTFSVRNIIICTVLVDSEHTCCTVRCSRCTVHVHLVFLLSDSI